MSELIQRVIQILRIKQVLARIGISRAGLYQRLDKKNAQYDPTFPTPIKLGANSVGWIEAEIDVWLASRISASRTPTSPNN